MRPPEPLIRAAVIIHESAALVAIIFGQSLLKISAAERLLISCRLLIRAMQKCDIVGHSQPLRHRTRGVREKLGHTECLPIARDWSGDASLSPAFLMDKPSE